MRALTVASCRLVIVTGSNGAASLTLPDLQPGRNIIVCNMDGGVVAKIFTFATIINNGGANEVPPQTCWHMLFVDSSNIWVWKS